jgi:hypothetical protein
MLSARILLTVPLLSLVAAFAAVAFLYQANPMDFVSQACPVRIASREDILPSGCLEVGELVSLWIGFSIPSLAIGFIVLALIKLSLTFGDPE